MCTVCTAYRPIDDKTERKSSKLDHMGHFTYISYVVILSLRADNKQYIRVFGSGDIAACCLLLVVAAADVSHSDREHSSRMVLTIKSLFGLLLLFTLHSRTNTHTELYRDSEIKSDTRKIECCDVFTPYPAIQTVSRQQTTTISTKRHLLLLLLLLLVVVGIRMF